MWSAIRPYTIGDFSLHKIARFIAAVLTPAFLWIVAFAPPALAVDATWEGDGLTYQDQTYRKLPQVPASTSIPDTAEAYEYRQPGTPTVANIIYFPPGTSVDGATSAQYVTYTVVGDTYSSPGPVTSIGILGRPPVDRSLGTSGTREDTANKETPCAIKGIGWAVCPATNFIADGMDVIFKLLKGFLEVQPLTLDTTNPMYRAWEIMRNLANIAFVLAFLVIIYGQITAHGMSNYEAKKMLPRLIIAAVLVNISYYICSIAVDVSNALGSTLQQLFLDMRSQLVSPNSVANNPVTWQSVTTAILSGGTVATAAAISVNMAVGGGTGVVALSYLLIPFLVGAILSVLVALLILAARQALITVLIVVSPLAFVAYLLPNTEKWFERWKDLYITMLMMFPIFSVIFGAAQLAGSAIIQNAKDINTIVIGLFVQAAPLAITPFLIKFGGQLAKVAGFVDNPNKGFLDRTRKWAGEKADESRKKRIAEGMIARNEGKAGFTPLRRWAVRGEMRRHEREHDMKKYDKTIEAAGDEHYKETLFGSEAPASINPIITRNRRSRQRRLQNMHAFEYQQEQAAKAFESIDEAQRQAAQAGQSDFYKRYEQGHHGLVKSSQDIAINTMAAQAAKRVTNTQLSAALEGKVGTGQEAINLGKELRVRAAGIEGQVGENRALAMAISTRHAERGEALKHINAIIEDVNPSTKNLLDLADGVSVQGIEITRDVREAAIKMIASGGNVEAVNKLSSMIQFDKRQPDWDVFLATAFTDALKANSARQPHMGFSLIEQLAQGQGAFGPEGFDKAIIAALKSNKFDAAGIMKSDPDTLKHISRILGQHVFIGEDREKIGKNLSEAFAQLATNPTYKGGLGNRKDDLQKIHGQMLNAFGMTPPDPTAADVSGQQGQAGASQQSGQPQNPPQPGTGDGSQQPPTPPPSGSGPNPS